MIAVYSSESIPIKSWVTGCEDGALNQALNLANLPFAFKHIALMPDCHQGYGMPIGGVMATKGVVVPNAVGVDIGCGMCAVKTSIKVEQLDTDTLKKIVGKIRESIPVGFDRHKESQGESFMPKVSEIEKHGVKNGYVCVPCGDCYPVINKEFYSALKQLGTLGGGNHFIEIQKDVDGNVWIMVHSGSRNLGYKVAQYYNKLAINLNERWFSRVPKDWDLAFFPIETKEAKLYLKEMQYCVDFALANRKLMLERIIDVFEEFCLVTPPWKDDWVFKVEPYINIAHNYARFENHFGQNVMVHRKGATSAKDGEIGIIPGSQGTNSYIVKGKGSPESFMSCSHGAGRKMGRKQACQELSLEEEIKKMDEQGIVHGIRHQKDLDEASGAYKSIGEVMENQSDLVEIVTELKPLAVIKS